MWQRFTERARRTVFLAQEEAAKLGEKYVSTEHLLLGLARENDSVAARIMDILGVPLEKARQEIERQVIRGELHEEKSVQMTPRAKRVIDLAYDEARLFNNNYIGTEHLLLGLIREGEGLAGRALEKLGIRLDATRSAVLLLQSEGKSEKDNLTPGAEGRMEQLQARIREMSELHGRPVAEAMAAALKDLTAGAFRTGDLGATRPAQGKMFVELAIDEAAYIALKDVYEAKDRHGYEKLKKGDTLLLLPKSVIVKRLSVPPGGRAAAMQGGIYVRVVSGEYEGGAGWMLPDACERIGPDDAPF